MGNDIRFVSFGPLSVLAIILLIGIVVLIIPLLLVGLIGKAFTALGLSWITAIALILLMLIGSLVTIPVYRMKRDVMRMTPSADGTLPGDSDWELALGVNFGGAILPLALSIYLMYKAGFGSMHSLLPVGAGIIAVACIAYAAARVVPGAGIQVPLLMPALTAILVSLILVGGTGTSASVSALTGGVIGTLLGGNIARLGDVKNSGASQFSIGGSGTFASVLICCILPALIA